MWILLLKRGGGVKPAVQITECNNIPCLSSARFECICGNEWNVKFIKKEYEKCHKCNNLIKYKKITPYVHRIDYKILKKKNT